MSDPVRSSPVITPFILSASLSNKGSFPPPALPGFCGTTSPSATLPARPAPHGVPVDVCAPPTGLPVLPPPPSSMRAAATTPAEPAGARVTHFPAGGSLPRTTGGSASALAVSGPARRSLALRPAWSLSRPMRPTPSKCFRLCLYLHNPLRLLPAGATVAGRDSHPLWGGAFSRRTIVLGIISVALVIGRALRRRRKRADREHVSPSPAGRWQAGRRPVAASMPAASTGRRLRPPACRPRSRGPRPQAIPPPRPSRRCP